MSETVLMVELGPEPRWTRRDAVENLAQARAQLETPGAPSGRRRVLWREIVRVWSDVLPRVVVWPAAVVRRAAPRVRRSARRFGRASRRGPPSRQAADDPLVAAERALLRSILRGRR